MQITRENSSDYINMMSNLFKGARIPDVYGTDWGNYEKRFTPTNRPFSSPDWSQIKTKTSSPAMSENDFDDAIRDLARKEFSANKKDHKSIQELMTKFVSPISPDRKALYNESMRKTGGKMNAACVFWDNQGNRSLIWHPEDGWSINATEAETNRVRQFYSIYNDELKRLASTYGDDSRGKISYNKIKDDLTGDSLSTELSEINNRKLDCYI